MRSLPFTRKKFLLCFLILALVFDEFSCKRGGGGGFGGRGSSSARSGGGLFGGSRRTGTVGGGGGSGGGYNSGGGGGLFGSSGNTYKNTQHNKGGYFGGGSKYDDRSKFGHSSSFARAPTYTKGNGIGSKLRSNTFKNMVVGAAAGYLTYQAGKAIIRSATSPMMWNNRPYYWGSDYYRPQHPNQPMCRMPMDNKDPTFGNVYFQDQTRPREVVWGCSYNEHCCGYECCPGAGGGYGGYGGGGGYGYYGGSGRSFGQFGLGSIIVLLLFCLCGGFIVHQLCKTRRSAASGGAAGWFQNNGGPNGWFGRNNKYSAGQASDEPPPQYSASGATYTYPPAPGFRS